MKLSSILFKQHIGKHFKSHWNIQGKRKILKTPAENLLTKQGITIFNPEDVYMEKKDYERIEVVGMRPKPVKFDQSHPNWHDTILLTYKDNNIPLEGLPQAQILTKSVQLKQGLPESYILKPLSKEVKNCIENIILGSHVFDAEQQKLPKRKDPKRPAWNFPRDYGVTYDRRNKLMTSKLLHFLESNESFDLVKERYILNDALFSFPFVKEGELVQLEITADELVVSRKPLSPVTTESTKDLELPNLHPIRWNITLNEENIYTLEDKYPIKKRMSACHPHTVFIHYDSTVVKNLFEEEVTDNQLYGRSLLKTFAVAASYAKQQFGADVKDLPVPVTVQCVHTDGRRFHFGVLQVNTLNLEEGGINNIWCQTEMLPLFEVCQYESGAPILRGYNGDVVKHLISFYGKC